MVHRAWLWRLAKDRRRGHVRQSPNLRKGLGSADVGLRLGCLEPQADAGQAEAADVELLLATANGLPWENADPVGEGEEYRAQQGEEVHASALALHDAPVHVSVVVAG